MNKEGLEYFKECVVLFSNFATQQIAERAVKAAAKGEPKELIRQLEEGKVHNQEMANKLLAKILESGKAPKRPTAGNPEKSEAPRLVMIYVTGRRVMGIDTSEAAGEIVGMQIKGLRGSTEVYASFTPGTAAFGASGTNVGFSVGGGIEGRLSWLSPNWTWKVEYLYLDLGSLDTAAPFSATFGVESTATGTVTTHTHFTDNIVRAGLNYQFH
jgi:hypothetical protein